MAMTVQVAARGEGMVFPDRGYYFARTHQVPSVGDEVSTEQLDELATALGYEDAKWKVIDIRWYFGELADHFKCDAVVFVSFQGYESALDAFVNGPTTDTETE